MPLSYLGETLVTTRLSGRRAAGLCIAATLITAHPILAQIPGRLRDSQEVREVQAQSVVTLDFATLDVAPDIHTQVFRLPDGGWGAASGVFRGTVPVFSATGSPNGTLGRSGSGPGEFMTPAYGVSVNGELWVVDTGNSRLSAFASDGTLIGDRRLPGWVLWAQPTADGHQILLSGSFRGSSGVWRTVARATLGGTTDILGGDVGDSHDAYVQHHVAAQTISGEIWAVAQSGGKIEILQADNLQPLGKTHLPDSLSEPEYHAVTNIVTQRPPPMVSGVMTDSDGLLWVVMAVADANWRARTGSDRTTRPPVEKLWDTLILAVSPQDRAIVGTKRIDGICVGVVGGLISCANEAAATIEVQRLRLER